ncbi:hypothetical protein NDU88_001827 [Pleurodeles waltl]|uniref:Uncharacterized protein n=1 Tax=Pleurodeles waltl TaxID=8319 RepID=A0AAV7KUE9_PLEWA|nr:hypothetical protein NDU88_001827 [Pleurodeles waltl]
MTSILRSDLKVVFCDADGFPAGKEVPCLPLSPEIQVIPNILCSNQYGPLAEKGRFHDCVTHLQSGIRTDDITVAKLPPNMGRLPPLCGDSDLAPILQKLDEVKSLVQLLMNQLTQDLAQKCVCNCLRGGVWPALGGLPIDTNVPEVRPRVGNHPRGSSITSLPENSPVSPDEGSSIAPVTVRRRCNAVIKDKNIVRSETFAQAQSIDYIKSSWGVVGTQVPAGVAIHTHSTLPDDAVHQVDTRRSILKDLGRGRIYDRGA